MIFFRIYAGHNQEFHLGGSMWRGRTNDWPKVTSGDGEIFRNFCFGMVHFGAKLTNAVHHHWFSGAWLQ